MGINSQNASRSGLASLFSNDVITEETYFNDRQYDILPEEEALIKNAVPKRQKEFRAGRYCVGKALMQINVSRCPVLIGQNREPIWPKDIVGSISHTDGYCCVALAHKRDVLSIGLDVEHVHVIDDGVWKYVCTKKELFWILSLPHDERNKYLFLVFSAKESIYKCQFQVSKQCMSFHDVEISLASNNNSFQAVIRTEKNTVFPRGYSFIGDYLFINRYIFTGVTLRNSCQE